jgi:GDP-fucose protein O-fucosyltransferase
MQCSTKFLTYIPWPGDLNNTRMCFETALVLAFLSNRALVIPNDYRTVDEPEWLDGVFRPVHPKEFLDFDSISRAINMISYDEFASCGLEDQAIDLSFGVNSAVFCYPQIPELSSSSYSTLIEFASGRRHFLELTDATQRCMTLNIKRAMLEHFYSFFFFADVERANECKSLIKEHVQFRPEIVNLGTQIASRLGMFSAVHVRRGDFVRHYPTQDISAQLILKNMIKHVPPGTRLYVSTDESSHSFFAPFHELYEVIFSSDIRALFPADMSKESLACLEQVICSLAQSFVGTKLSTFSGYITRLRGYRDAPNKEINFTDGYEVSESSLSKKDSFSWISWVKEGNPIWGREYREAWESHAEMRNGLSDATIS